MKQEKRPQLKKTVSAWSEAMCLAIVLLCAPYPVFSLVASIPSSQPTPQASPWCVGSQTWSLREEHRIGDLPWAAGEEPIARHYAGHIPIRSWSEPGSKGGETSMYYWFIPAIKPKKVNPPLIVWLQGGPGSSSMIGLFFEMGPLWVDADMKLRRRDFSWAEEYSMLFIDQPVGTGYSYVTHDGESNQKILRKLKILLEREQDQEASLNTNDAVGDQLFTPRLKQRTISLVGTRGDGGVFIGDETSGRHGGVGPLHFHGYVKDQRGVAADLMVFLHEFFRRYPEQRESDLYLTGESYAGKFVPTFADAIMQFNQNLKQRRQSEDENNIQNEGNSHLQQDHIHLRGIALGNSLTDPVSQITAYADQAFYLGYLDPQQHAVMSDTQQQAVEAAARLRFLDSNKHRNDMFRLFSEATGGINWYDVRKGQVPNDWSRMEQFMNLEAVKDALNVFGPRLAFLQQMGCTEDEIKVVVDGRNKTRYEKDEIVREAMASDIMRTAAPIVGQLLDQGIQVLTYQGVFDFRDGVAGSHYWIDHLPWYGQERFRQQTRKLWFLPEIQNVSTPLASDQDKPSATNAKSQLAGYITKYDRLTKVAVLGAGHLAPMDQGRAMQHLIRSLIENMELDIKKKIQQDAMKQHTI